VGLPKVAGRGTIASSFDPRRNSLNALRLVLATMVIVTHSFMFGGFGLGNFRQASLAGYAVDGFFGISGFLLVDSAMKHGVIRFLWMRCLRIFPAFWVCLVVVAFGFGVVGWLHTHPALHGYFTAPLGPFRYLPANWFLHLGQLQISGTPAHVPFPLVWDGAPWTLKWEFLCYIGIAALAVVGVLQKRRMVLALLGAAWLVELLVYLHPVAHTTAILRFAPLFLGGAVLRLYGDRIPDSGWLAALMVPLVAVGSLPYNPDLIGGMALVYLLVWLGVRLPLQRVGARNDFSYGTYLYAYPAGQLLAVWHLQRFGYVPFTLVTIALTVPFAVGSWFLIERHALRLKSWSPRWALRWAQTD
jgi:peptidoglycan/LPS O-acetylase OafA/YrhL